MRPDSTPATYLHADVRSVGLQSPMSRTMPARPMVRLASGVLMAALLVGSTACTSSRQVAASTSIQQSAAATAPQAPAASVLSSGSSSPAMAASDGSVPGSVSSSSSVAPRTTEAGPPTSSIGAPTVRSTKAGTTPSGASVTGTPTVASVTVTQTPPSSGDILHTVAPRPVTTAPAVGLTQAAKAAGGLEMALTKIQRIQASAQGPGEISGPALQLTLRVDNKSSRDVALNNVLVSLTDAQSDPGLPMTGSPASPLTGTLAPGQSTSGTYVFSVRTPARTRVSINVSYDTDSPVVVFTGSPA